MCDVPHAARTLTVEVREPLRAKNLDNPSEDTRFIPDKNRLRARVVLSSYRMPWLIILTCENEEGVKKGKRFGWPQLAIATLIDQDRVRVYDEHEEELQGI